MKTLATTTILFIALVLVSAAAGVNHADSAARDDIATLSDASPEAPAPILEDAPDVQNDDVCDGPALDLGEDTVAASCNGACMETCTGHGTPVYRCARQCCSFPSH